MNNSWIFQGGGGGEGKSDPGHTEEPGDASGSIF